MVGCNHITVDVLKCNSEFWNTSPLYFNVINLSQDSKRISIQSQESAWIKLTSSILRIFANIFDEYCRTLGIQQELEKSYDWDYGFKLVDVFSNKRGYTRRKLLKNNAA